MYETKPYFYGTGRRKHSVARVRVYNGTGKMTINGRDINDYFGLETLKLLANSPLVLTENEGKFDVVVNVVGGGCAGQAGAIRHGLSRALLQFNPELRATLTTAKEMGYKRLIAVHQPFTYSRTKLLFNDFVDVLKIPDITVLTPIMGSREPNDPTITSAKLAAQIPGSVLVNSLEEAAEWVKQNAREGDLVITLGCGDIYKASKMMVAEQP